MATVGNLFVNVGASTAGLARGLSDGQQKVDKFAQKVSQTLGGIGRIVPDMGGIGNALGDAIDKFDALKGMASVFTEGVKAARKAQDELTKAIESSKAAEAALAAAKGARRNVGAARRELIGQGIDPNKAAQALSIVDTSPMRDKVAKSAQAARDAEKALADAQTAGAALTASEHAKRLAAMRDQVAKATDKVTQAEQALKAAQYRSTIAKGGRDPWTGRFTAAQSVAKQEKAERDLAKAVQGVADAKARQQATQDALNATQAAGPILQGQEAIRKATDALTSAKAKQVEAERALGDARKRNQRIEQIRSRLSARGIDTANLPKSLRLTDLKPMQQSVEAARKAVEDKQAALSKATSGFKAFGLVGRGAMLAVGAVAAAAVISVGSLLAITRSAARAMATLKDEAAATGSSIEGLQRIKNILAELGIAEGVATMGMQRLSMVLSDAVKGSDEARDKFSRLGLNYQQIAAMSPDEALAATIAHIRSLGSQQERVAALRDIFGKQGMGLAAAVGATNEELATARRRAEQLVIPSSMVKDLAATDGSVQSMGRAFEKVKTMLASTFSPVLRDLADSMFDLMTADTDALLGGLQSIALVCAVIYDVVALVVNVLRLAWNIVQALAGLVVSGLAAAFAAVAKVVQAVAYGIEWLLGQTHGISSAIGDAAATAWGTAGEAAKAAGGDAAEAWSSAVDAINPNATTAVIEQIGKSWDKTGEQMGQPIEINPSLDESKVKEIERTLANLRDKASELELGEQAATIARLAAQGATEAQIAEARALQARIASLEAAASIAEEIAKAEQDIAKATMDSRDFVMQRAKAEGASDAQAQRLADLASELELVEAQKKAMEDTASVLEEMRNKVDAIGRSEGDVLAAKLAQNGATREQIDEAMRLQGILDAAKVSESLGEHFAKLNDKLAEAQGGQQALLEQQLKNMGLAGDALADAVSKSVEIEKQIAAAEKAAADRKSLDNALADLEEEFANIGLDEVGKLARKLSSLGASEAEIARASEMQRAIDAAKQTGEGVEKAQGVTDSVATAIGNLTLAGTVIDDSAWQGSLLDETRSQSELLAAIAANTASVPVAEPAARDQVAPAVRGVDRSETEMETLLAVAVEQLRAISANTRNFAEVLS